MIGLSVWSRAIAIQLVGVPVGSGFDSLRLAGYLLERSKQWA
jgi:hypothetical protein